MVSPLSWTRPLVIASAALLVSTCGDAGPIEPDPVSEGAVPTGASIVTIAGAGIQEAQGEFLVGDDVNCEGFFTRNCVVCRDVTMSAIVSGPAGTTAVLDSSRSTYTNATGAAFATTNSHPQAFVASVWGTTVLEAGRVYTTQPQSFKAELPFRVTRTFFFRSGDLATRGSFSFAFTCT